MSTLRKLLAENAKAVTALIVTAAVQFAARHNLVLDTDAVSSVVGALISAAIVWAVPNKPKEK